MVELEFEWRESFREETRRACDLEDEEVEDWKERRVLVSEEVGDFVFVFCVQG